MEVCRQEQADVPMVQESRNEAAADVCSDEFHQVKELGKKYSSLFGVEKTVSREAIAAIHRLVGPLCSCFKGEPHFCSDGILFAIGKDTIDPRKKKAPVNLSFLEIVAEFTPKLLPQDKMSM